MTDEAVTNPEVVVSVRETGEVQQTEEEDSKQTEIGPTPQDPQPQNNNDNNMQTIDLQTTNNNYLQNNNNIQPIVLPPGWRIGKTNEGQTYYINDITQTTQWNPPNQQQLLQTQQLQQTQIVLPQQQTVVLPQGWRMAKTNDGKIYYINDTTQTTQWNPPNIEPSVNLQTQPQVKVEPNAVFNKYKIIWVVYKAVMIFIPFLGIIACGTNEYIFSLFMFLVQFLVLSAQLGSEILYFKFGDKNPWVYFWIMFVIGITDFIVYISTLIEVIISSNGTTAFVVMGIIFFVCSFMKFDYEFATNNKFYRLFFCGKNKWLFEARADDLYHINTLFNPTNQYCLYLVYFGLIFMLCYVMPGPAKITNPSHITLTTNQKIPAAWFYWADVIVISFYAIFKFGFVISLF